MLYIYIYMNIICPFHTWSYLAMIQDLEVIATKWYSSLPKVSRLKPHLQMLFNVIHKKKKTFFFFYKESFVF